MRAISTGANYSNAISWACVDTISESEAKHHLNIASFMRRKFNEIISLLNNKTLNNRIRFHLFDSQFPNIACDWIDSHGVVFVSADLWNRFCVWLRFGITSADQSGLNSWILLNLVISIHLFIESILLFYVLS